MLSKELIVRNKTGLHARPAAEFVKEAAKFKSVVSIIFNGKTFNAKSIIHVLSAGIVAGSTIALSADGEDEAQAIDKLSDVILGFEE